MNIVIGIFLFGSLALFFVGSGIIQFNSSGSGHYHPWTDCDDSNGDPSYSDRSLVIFD